MSGINFRYEAGVSSERNEGYKGYSIGSDMMGLILNSKVLSEFTQSYFTMKGEDSYGLWDQTRGIPT